MSVAERQTPVGDPLIGARIDARYLIEAVHGCGGMSVVYAGMHEDLRRKVAIKVLDGAWASDAEVVERFLIEARTASSITHPNVVPVSDLGRLPDGRPYLVMPMIAGHDLATLLAQEGPQPARRVATLLWGAALALDLIHRKGLVHRDIKSENLMHVVNDDGSETVLVLDFGIAGALGLPNVDNAAGTPEFMPPEALNGAAPDHRADVYALATVAFELLTGSLPYDSGDLSDLIAKKSTELPRKLSDVGLARFSDALEAVVGRALALHPEDRHDSATAFMREFEAAVAHAPDSEPISEVSPIPAGRGGAARGSPTLMGTGIPFFVRPAGAPAVMPTPTSGDRPRKGTLGPGTLLGNPFTAGELAEAEVQAEAQAEAEVTGAPHDLADRDTAPPVPRTAVSGAASAKAASVRAAQSAKAASAKVSRILRMPKVPPQPAGRYPFDPLPLSTPPTPMASVPAEPPPPAGAEALEPATDSDDEFESQTRLAIVELPADVAMSSLQPVIRMEIEEDDEAVLFGTARTRGRTWLYLGGGALAIVTVIAVGRSLGPDAPASSVPAAAASAPESPAPQAAPAPIAPQPATVISTPPTVVVPAATSSTPTVPAAANVPERAPTASERRAERRRERAERATATAPTRAARTPAPAPRLRVTPAPEPASRPTARAAAPKAPPAPAAPEAAAQATQRATDAMLRGDLAAAARLFDQAIAANPSDAGAHRGKALVLERQGRTREAAAAFREFLRLRPSGPASDKVRERLKELESK